MKPPPYGRELAARLKFNNDPDHVVVCVGLDAWSRAKRFQACPNNVHALVWPPGTDPRDYRWPVAGLLVVVQTACGPDDAQCRDLASVLLAYGAEVVTVISVDGLNTFHQFISEKRSAA